mmetsp:Transcript_22415/g.72445  ORF Transcript_22415/g.72445 Transcript_22415/m.72445 type:complete len:212 (+) Transcript_22415:101-736(+)
MGRWGCLRPSRPHSLPIASPALTALLMLRATLLRHWNTPNAGGGRNQNTDRGHCRRPWRAGRRRAEQRRGVTGPWRNPTFSPANRRAERILRRAVSCNCHAASRQPGRGRNQRRALWLLATGTGGPPATAATTSASQSSLCTSPSSNPSLPPQQAPQRPPGRSTLCSRCSGVTLPQAGPHRRAAWQRQRGTGGSRRRRQRGSPRRWSVSAS